MKMTKDYAPQYQKPCVLLSEMPETASEIINYAVSIGAHTEEEPGERSFVIQFPGRPQELYSAHAILRTVRQAICK